MSLKLSTLAIAVVGGVVVFIIVFVVAIAGAMRNVAATSQSCGTTTTGTPVSGDPTSGNLPMPQNLSAGKLVAQGYYQAGFRGDDLVEMVAIDYAESNWSANGANGGAGSDAKALMTWQNGLPGGSSQWAAADPTPGSSLPAPDLISESMSGQVKQVGVTNVGGASGWYWAPKGPFVAWQDERPGQKNPAGVPVPQISNPRAPGYEPNNNAARNNGHYVGPNTNYEEGLKAANTYISQWVPNWSKGTTKGSSTLKGGGSTPSAPPTDVSNQSQCSPASSGGSIVSVAEKLAWPSDHGAKNPKSATASDSLCPWAGDQLAPGCGKKESTAAYIQATQQFDSSKPAPAGQPASNQMYASCDHFVATVLHMTGVDPNYPLYGTGAQASYLASHPKIWRRIKSGPVPAGAIMINPGIHTWIYLGHGNGAEASNDDHSATQESFPATGNGPLYAGAYQAWVPVHVDS